MKHKRSCKIYPLQKSWAAKTLRRGKKQIHGLFFLNITNTFMLDNTLQCSMILHQSMERMSLLFLSENISASTATVVSYKVVCDQH